MRTMTLALGGSAIVGLAIGAAIWMRPLPKVDEPLLVATPEEVAPAEAEEDIDPQAPAEVVAEDSTPPEEPAAHLPETVEFRFEPDGAILLSGQAEAGLPVAVMVDGVEAGRIEVMADGMFLYLGDLGFSESPRVLQVVSDPDGAGLTAERSFVLAANPAPAPVAELTNGVPASDTVVAEAPETPANGGDVAVAAVEEALPAADEAAPVTSEIAELEVQTSDAPVFVAEQAAPSAPAILAVTEDGVEVVQPSVATDVAPEVMSTVALDTITYDPQGEVVLGGRAVGAGFVQVYVDNAPVSRLPVDEDGRWRGDLPDVDKGVYTLRIDEVDVDGVVVSRIETPFLREDPEDVIEAMADAVDNPAFTVATRTVQPGATLWAIAEERYGDGVLYVNVFEANRDRIRNPDLIYPGQVFVLPEDDS